MKKFNLLIVLSLWLVAVSSFAQKKYSVYAVGFYNQENLFDTCHDEGKKDYEYLPTGSSRWNGLKYSHKLRNMAKVLADMGTDVLPDVGCAVIGLSEVENANVLNDLTAQEPLRARGYKYVHIEGPDSRGIDCALLYNPSMSQSISLHCCHTYLTRPCLPTSARADSSPLPASLQASLLRSSCATGRAVSLDLHIVRGLHSSSRTSRIRSSARIRQ